jgi:hypothetical protein
VAFALNITPQPHLRTMPLRYPSSEIYGGSQPPWLADWWVGGITAHEGCHAKMPKIVKTKNMTIFDQLHTNK